MARQEVNIGVEGNDGTGDSIRASFKKVNENFVELYAVFGQGGQINFTNLSDTPNVYTPHTIPLVNKDPNGNGTFLGLAELTSDESGSVEFDYVDGVGDTPGKIIIKAGFSRVADDVTPKLGGDLYGSNKIIAGVFVPDETDNQGLAQLQALADQNDINLTLDNVVITKGFADQRYIPKGSLVTLKQEPPGVLHYTFQIFDYITADGSIRIVKHVDESSQTEVGGGHGLTALYNGFAVTFTADLNIPDALLNGQGNLYDEYYIRVIDDQHIWLYTDKQFAITGNQFDAEQYKLDLSLATIDPLDSHSISFKNYDPTLTGNFLNNQAVPRESLVLRSGDEMTGPLYLNDHPGDLGGVGTVNGKEDLQAATKLYVDQGSAHSHTDVLFVSTDGDDTMQGVPAGKEGSSPAYAFSSIGAAAKRAATLIRTADSTLGPYLQRLTYTVNDTTNETYVLNYAVEDGPEDGGFNSLAVSLLTANKDYIAAETLAYIDFTYPDFSYNKNYCYRDVKLLLDAIIFDMYRGTNTNTLTIQAAEKYYSSVSGRRAITQQLTETTAGFEFAKQMSYNVLWQILANRKLISVIEKSYTQNNTVISTRVNFLTQLDTIYEDGSAITFSGILESGLENEWSFLNNQTYYIQEDKFAATPRTSFYIFLDQELTNPIDTSNLTNPLVQTTNNIYLGKRWQTEELQFFDANLDGPALGTWTSIWNAVDSKWDLIIDIITNIEDENLPNVVYGKPYQIKLKNTGATFLDQTASSNPDALPGKVIQGVRSEAIGRIINYENTIENIVDPVTGQTEASYTLFNLNLLSAKHFEIGEPLIFANYIKKKEVTIRIESGNYYEDYPIKIANNVSVKGDEFRRVIIQPKVEQLSKQARVSQSKWANTYFYRDSYFDNLTLTTNGTSQFINQVGENQGWFGFHYLNNPSLPLNVDNNINIDNAGQFSIASEILIENIDFFKDETIAFITSQFPALNYDTDKCLRDVEMILTALSHDFIHGGEEMTLEVQGSYHGSSYAETNHVLEDTPDQTPATIAAMDHIKNIAEILLQGSLPSNENYTLYTAEDNIKIINDLSGNQAIGENTTAENVVKMIDKIKFVFDTNYNPPKRTDEMDVFLLGDTTIIRNVTCRGHGGFMCVLDPDGQILTKSPYTQTASSFSKSVNKQTFSGGMFVDAFVGNIPATIIADAGNTEFKLRVESNPGEGLYIRPPQLPCPFYLDGIRYQVNAISDYDQGVGQATIYLDTTSGPKIAPDSNIGQGFDLNLIPQTIFLQTAGNRSLLGNDFTQVNDLGYGLVVTNGAFSEMVSMFTYYCHVAYYAANGAEIRSLNGSNGYGNFALVSEGADPNEIPDQVVLKNNMVRPAKIYTGTGSVSGLTYSANVDQNSIVVYDLPIPPLPQSVIRINHNGQTNADGLVLNVVNYRIGSVSNVTVLTGDTAQVSTTDSTLYRLEFRGDDIIKNDYFSLLQTVVTDAIIDYRDNIEFIAQQVANPDRLVTRPSTAINFDESDDFTYRTLDFQTEDPYGNNLPADEVRITIEQNYDFINLEPSLSSVPISTGYNEIACTWMTINKLNSIGDYSYAQRLTDPVGEKVFSFRGKSHRVIKYSNVFEIAGLSNNLSVSQHTDVIADAVSNPTFSATIALTVNSSTLTVYDVIGEYPSSGNIFLNGTDTGILWTSGTFTEQNYAIINFTDETDIVNSGGSGLAESLHNYTNFTSIPAGLSSQSTAEITIAISLLRATGHDFTQIGTGGFNTSNYPNVILGDPILPVTDTYWSNAPSGQLAAQVWEKRKGRVFWVSTDQYGFFRVGRFFSVDQGTGSITFSGEVGISNANALGFKKGVTIDEFSADETMLDSSSNAVPTEKAVRNYIALVLGIDPHNPVFPGPGFLPLTGLDTAQNSISMTGRLGMGGNKIENVGIPNSGTDAVNKNYVDSKVNNFLDFSGLRDFYPSVINANIPVDISANQILIGTGKYVLLIKTSTIINGPFIVNDVIKDAASNETKTGTILQIYTYNDLIEGNLTSILYTLNSGSAFDSLIDTKIYSGTKEGEILRDLQGQKKIGGSFPEITSATQGTLADGNEIEYTTVRESNSARVVMTISSNVIDNANINASAAISQSKLALQKAVTFDEDNATTGWNGSNPAISQSNLGLSAFSDENFDVEVVSSASTGRVRIKTNGIKLSDLEQIATNYVLGNVAGSTGNVQAISFNTITSSGGSLLKSLFTTNGLLTKTGADSWGVTSTSISATANTVVVRDSNGGINSEDVIFTGSIKFNQSGTARLIFSSGGTGQIRVNGIAPTTTTIQGNNVGYVATSQIYAKGIGSLNLNPSTSVGANIYLGADTGSINSSANSIVFYSNGADRFKIDGNSFVAINAGNLGSASQAFGTVYGDVFSGYATKSRYADLAENYLADDEYFEGTVLVFGGDAEITVTNVKGDKRVAGIVSTNPAHLMNEALKGEHVTPLALQGRVPCKVIGKVAKGDMLVTSAIPGYAIVDNDPRIGTVLGKAVGEKTDDGKGVVEIVVGRL